MSKTHSPSLANSQREEWQDGALYTQVGDEPFFPPDGGHYETGRKICMECTVRLKCLTYILKLEQTSDDRVGMFGGMTPNERRILMGEPPRGNYRKAE